MLDRALRRLEKQGIWIDEYYEPMIVVRERIEKDPTAFDSAPEMIAVMELLRQRVRIQLHKKIAGHEVDMILPDERVVLEIDGFVHSLRLEQDFDRDRRVLAELGPGWEVIRIPADHIEKNVQKLIPAVRIMRDKQQQLRANNNGLLPDWYSRRTKAKLKKVLKPQDVEVRRVKVV